MRRKVARTVLPWDNVNSPQPEDFVQELPYPDLTMSPSVTTVQC